MVENPHLEGMKAKLKELSNTDPLGFRKAAAWDAIMAAPDLAQVRTRLSADHIQRLLSVITPAVLGAHDWFTYGRLNWECCRVCGIARRMDGKVNKPCKGPVAVGPRADQQTGESK